MKRIVSQSTIQTFSSVFLVAGMMILPGTLQAEQGMGSQSPVGSGSDVSAPDVQAHPNSGFGTQWSDQLKRERDQAKQSRDQAKQERDKAKQERDQALQASKSQGGQSGMKSIQGQSSSGQSDMQGGNQETSRLSQERDQYIQERNQLQEETDNLRQERDRAMQSIAGGSALDAVDRTMPVTPRH